jgi:hypothetical protein
MTGKAQKEKILAAHPCGDRVLTRPAAIGARRLPDRKDRGPRDLSQEISLQAGRPNWRAPIAVHTLHNRNGAAGREGASAPAQRGAAGG